MYGQGSIIKRIRVLEQKYLVPLPVIIVEYADRTTACFEGMLPIEELFKEDNPVVKTYGSEFAELLNVIINSVPNRNIEDYE